MPPKKGAAGKAKANPGPKAKVKAKGKAKGMAKKEAPAPPAPHDLGVANPFSKLGNRAHHHIYISPLKGMVERANGEVWSEQEKRDMEEFINELVQTVTSNTIREMLLDSISKLEAPPGQPANVETWNKWKASIIDKVNAVALTQANTAGSVLLTFRGEGYGASVSVAVVVDRAEWTAFKAAILAGPVEEISNESVGGRTSDCWMTSHEIVRTMAEVTDPERVGGFIKAFPDGWFGSGELLGILCRFGNIGF